GRARESLGVLAHALQHADNTINLATDAVARGDRLLAALQNLDLLVGPLSAVIVAPRLLCLVNLRALVAEVIVVGALELFQAPIAILLRRDGRDALSAAVGRAGAIACLHQ